MNADALDAPSMSRIARGDPVEARDASGEVIFRYEPDSGRAAIRLPGAALTISSTDGILEIHAPGGIRLRTEGTLAIEARAIEIEAGSISARARLSRMAWGKLEVSVGRLFEWAGAAYRRVDGLLHTRAGRIRTQSRGAALLQADTARIQAKNEVRIDGSSVHLG